MKTTKEKKSKETAKPVNGSVKTVNDGEKRKSIAEYQHAYYLAHKNDKKFRERRRRNDRKRRSNLTDADRQKRNKRLRERWATDPEYRRKTSAYQKAWRSLRKAKGLKKALKGKK